MRVGALFSALAPILLILSSCALDPAGYRGTGMGPANMGGPSRETRAAQIASEPTGDFFYGRRYYVHKTRFWGYVRRPGEAATRSRLVIMNESQRRNPDRFPENGPPGRRYGFDNNYEYRLRGYFTGETAYDPNSNQFLPEFMLTNYELVDRDPGWLFRPADHYDPYRFTLLP